MSIKPRPNDQVDRPLPSSLDAEKGILCSILLQPDCLDSLTGITAGSFHHPAHAEIYLAMIAMRVAGTPIDLVTLTQKIADKGSLNDIGGAATLASLQTHVPTAQNVSCYAEIVQQKKALRDYITISQRGMDAAYAGDFPTGEITQLATITPETGKAPDSELTFRTISEILKMEFSDDDLYLGNGYLQKGGTLAIVGSGGVGKSRLAMQLAICSAAGLPFLGWETRGNPKWLFMQTENGSRRLKHDLSRMTSLCDDRDMAHLDDRIVLHTIEKPKDSMLRPYNIEGEKRLIDAVNHHDPDVVVFDVLRDFGIGDLNADEGMTLTLDAITRIVKSGRTDRSIVVLHHARTGKAAAAGAFGYDRANFGRNSKVLLGWARAVLNVAPLSEEDNCLVGVGSGKNNDFIEIKPVAIRLNPANMIYRVDDQVDVAAQIASLSESAKKEPKAKSSYVVELVESAYPLVLDRKTLVARLMKDRGVSDKTAYRVIADAERMPQGIKFSSKIQGFFSLAKKSDEKMEKAA